MQTPRKVPRKRSFAFALLLCVTSCFLSTALGEEPNQSEPVEARDRFSDSHVHIIDFLQNGAFDNRDGRFRGASYRGRIESSEAVRYLSLPYGEQWRRLTLLLQDMDGARVDQAMITGMPFIKKWSENEPFERPRYYLDSSSQMVRARDTDYLVGGAVMDYRQHFAGNEDALRQLDRLYPFVSGLDGTDLGAVDLVIKRIKEFPGVWAGIGEVMSRHDDLTNLTTGERPRGNHWSLKRLCRFAGESYLPVSIHHNIAPISRSADEVKEPVYLDELVELFEYCPGTTFIWDHAGISRRVVIDDLPYWIDAVLQRFKGQVYVDLSWVVYEEYIVKDFDGWAALIRKYPESFMLGSDVVGGAETMGAELGRYQSFLARLAPDVNDPIRRNLAKDNFIRVMMELKELRWEKMTRLGLASPSGPKPIGIIIPPEYEFDERAHTGAPTRSFVENNRH